MELSFALQMQSETGGLACRLGRRWSPVETSAPIRGFLAGNSPPDCFPIFPRCFLRRFKAKGKTLEALPPNHRELLKKLEQNFFPG